MTTEARRRAVPLTLRLTTIYTLLVAATLLVVAAVALQLTRSHLAAELDRRLTAVVESFRSGPGAEVEAADQLAAAARRWIGATAVPQDQVVVVATADGAVLSSAGGIDLERIERWSSLVASDQARFWDTRGPDGDVRALTTPLMVGDVRAGTLVVAGSRASQNDTIAGLMSGIAWASALGLVFAGLLGFAAVRRTMRPLRRMATEVEGIQRSDDLSRRVGGEGPPDEVGRLGAAFDDMLARLDEAFRSQRRFLSDASHELRTPLQVARGQLEFLEEGLRGPEPRRSLAVATEELERMRRIVDDLLLLARLDEGMPLQRQPVEVELVVREALLRGMLLSHRDHRVEVEGGLYALADPDRLLQVLTNLMTNAVKHAGEDATVVIAARRQGSRVRIDVADDGPGIPPDDLPHVFERLYRGSRARTDSPAGAGLGLAIAASLTRAMDGEIEVRSTPGEGTTFSLWLPAADAAVTEPITTA
jgi:two-component system OmpR family sensor kinase